MATSAVSAGDVGDGVTETRDGSAGTSVESRQHSILLTALLAPNATHQISSSHCWILARQVWL